MFYTVPYWRTLEDVEPEQSEHWLEEWRRRFLQDPQARQIAQIQIWLSRYDLEPVYVDGVLLDAIPQTEYGKFGKVTQVSTWTK